MSGNGDDGFLSRWSRRKNAAATGTDTFEVNRNLVLTDGARADSVPNLEIETGEIVGAGHVVRWAGLGSEERAVTRAAHRRAAEGGGRLATAVGRDALHIPLLRDEVVCGRERVAAVVRALG